MSVVLALSSSGCSTIGADLDATLGPGLRLQKASADESTVNYVGVRAAFIKRAGFPVAPPPGNAAWDQVIEAGFGYVDERCNAFIDALYRAERHKLALSSQISTTSTSAAAILGHVGVTAKALNVVADAFGLAKASSENLYNSVLYNMRPSTIQTMLNALRGSHREAFRRAPDASRDQVPAMTQISDYLALCLPANLEARIETTLNQTSFLRQPDGTYVNVSVRPDANYKAIEEAKNGDRLSKQAAERAAKALRGQIGNAYKDPIQQTPKPGVNAQFVDNALTPFENVTVEIAAQIQLNLCAPVSNDFGATDASPTRQAIIMFKLFRNPRSEGSQRPDGRIDSTGLKNAIINSGTCKAPYRNVYEKLMWGTGSPRYSPQTFNTLLATALEKAAKVPASKISATDLATLVPELKADSTIGAMTTRRGLELIARSVAKPPTDPGTLTPDVQLKITQYNSIPTKDDL